MTAHAERNGCWCCRACGLENGLEPTAYLSLSQGRNGRGGIAEAVQVTAEAVSTFRASTAFAVPPLPSLHGSELEAYDRNDDFAQLVFDRAGLSLDPSHIQPWHLGALDVAVEAWRDKGAFHRLRLKGSGWPADVCRRNGKAPKALALAEVFASTWANAPLLPSAPELARWKRRALLLGGFAAPPAVSIAKLPEDAPLDVVATWQGIRELVDVRSLTEPDVDLVPLSAPFLARWCPLDENAVRRAKAWLGRRGFIERAVVAEFGFPRPCVLWKIRGGRRPELWRPPEEPS
jgi:hypothetical protein